jgi:hypothetical protein
VLVIERLNLKLEAEMMVPAVVEKEVSQLIRVEVASLTMGEAVKVLILVGIGRERNHGDTRGASRGRATGYKGRDRGNEKCGDGR